MKTVSVAALAGALALSLSTAAHAAFPTFYGNAADFDAAGTIVQSTNFDSYGSNLTILSLSETYGHLTLQGDPLAVVGPDSILNPVRNLITTGDPGQSTNGLIDQAGYNMLGFKMADLVGYGEQVFVQLLTNVTTYDYGLYPGSAPENLTFYGFVVPVGEYFTGFKMSRTDVDGNFQETPIDQRFGLTDIEIGATAAPCNSRTCDVGGGIPEPASWALMILGLGGVGATLRARRAATGV